MYLVSTIHSQPVKSIPRGALPNHEERSRLLALSTLTGRPIKELQKMDPEAASDLICKLRREQMGLTEQPIKTRPDRLTPKQIEYIRSSTKSGRDLAVELGVVAATISRVRHAKVRTPTELQQLRAANIATATALRDRGMSYQAIAEEMDQYASTIQRWLCPEMIKAATARYRAKRKATREKLQCISECE